MSKNEDVRPAQRDPAHRVGARTATHVTMLVIWLAGLSIAGCPDVRRGGPEASCVKAYAQCRLPTGALGVCDVVECPAGAATPCLMCRSQH